jgi:hypothetical protein
MDTYVLVHGSSHRRLRTGSAVRTHAGYKKHPTLTHSIGASRRDQRHVQLPVKSRQGQDNPCYPARNYTDDRQYMQLNFIEQNHDIKL